MQIQNTKNSATGTGKGIVQFNSLQEVTDFLDKHLTPEQKRKIEEKLPPVFSLLEGQAAEDTAIP
jgi:hypothetical protein